MSQKLHKPLYLGIINCLTQIFSQRLYADKVIERVFKEHKQWGSRDRGLVAETVYDIVRHWRRLNEALELNYQTPDPTKFDALLQVYFWDIKKQDFSFDWKLPLDREKILKRLKELELKPEVLYSVPEWMNEMGKAQCNNWEQELAALNQQAPLILRVNTLKTTVQEVKQSLANEGMDCRESILIPSALFIPKRFNVFAHSLFKEGLVEVQDEGSQVIGEFCAVKPGMRVVDACAGAGGKTLQLAAYMQNKGRLIAMDVELYKLEELKKRARRNGAFNIEPRLIEGQKTIKKLESSADVVLLDVPCSGTGVLRRNPDAKWKLTPQFLEQVKQTQSEILSVYSKMVKPGGTLIYSTCSMFSSENAQQVNRFLEANSMFTLQEERTLTPFTTKTDGFYMAKLIRN